jgi:Yip1 domain
MSGDVLSGERPGLFVRVRGILMRPQTEWERIAGEEPASLIGSYIVPLAILGAVISFAAGVLYSGFDVNAALAWRGVAALLYVVFAVLGVVVAAWLINFLAHRFGAQNDSGRARQLAAYAATPMLVAAVGALAPPVALIVTIAGAVYALILLAMGVGRLMPLPDSENNAPRFTLTFAAAAVVVCALASVFIGPLVNAGREAVVGAVEAVTPERTAPDIARRSAAELAIHRLAEAHGSPVLADPERLAAQMPDSLPGSFQRQSVATAQRGGISRADAVYSDGTSSLSVSVIQFGLNVDPAAFASVLEIKPDGAHEGGYARSQSIDGRLFAEDVTGQHARYVVIGRGVVMIAGGGVTVDRARAAVETIDLQRLEAMFSR